MRTDKDFYFTRERNIIREIEDITSTSLKDAITRNRSLLKRMLVITDEKGDDYYDIVSGKIRLALEEHTRLFESQKAPNQHAAPPTGKEYLIKKWDDESLSVNSIAILKDEWDEGLPKATTDPIQLFLYKFNFACYPLEIAALAYENGELDRAWSAINYTSLEVGELIGLENEILDEKANKQLSIQNTKNAEAKSESFTPTKNEAIRLIIEKRPEGGWESKQETIDAIELSLAEFIKENKVSVLTPTNVSRRLRAWLTKDKVLRVWEANSKQK